MSTTPEYDAMAHERGGYDLRKMAARAALASAPAAEPSTGNWISADDYHRNVRALDVALNGIEGAARRPLLIDVLSQVEAEVSRRGAPLLAHTAQPAPQASRVWRGGGTLTVADLVNNLLMMDQALPIYGAQYIEHNGRRGPIAVHPTVSRERVADGRWIGEGKELNAAVIWTRAEQPAPQAGAAEPFGYWHQGATYDESDFHLASESGDVSCENCVKLYAHPTEQPSQDAHPQAQAMAPADLSSILACEIECSVYEKHVAPVLERLGLAGVTVTLAPTCFADWLLAQPEPSAEALRQAGKWDLADAAFEAGRSAHIRGDA